MQKQNRQAPLLLLAAAALSQAGYTDCGQIIHDPGFDLWCGEDLCSWRIERGEVRKVPTWHQGDDGVELLGDDSAIYQMTGVTSQDTDCIRFEAVADIEETAEVTLDMDVFGDGTVEYSQVLPTARWAPVSYRVSFAGPYQGVRFRLSKRGSGRAVLAQIEAATADDCPDAPIALAPRADGAWCLEAADCASGVCNGEPFPFAPPPVCGACAGDADCAEGEACGVESYVPAHLAAYRGCGAPGRHLLGELCAEDAECATGICEQGFCSTCRSGVACADGQTCGVRPPPSSLIWPSRPWQCGPGAGVSAGGAFCLWDDDCAGGECAGGPLLQVCEADGRSCDADGDCPALSADEPGRCITVGTAGGICQ